MSAWLVHAAVWIPAAFVTAVAMDFWAALLHRRVWHAWLWSVHASHHEPRPAGERLEKNDALSILHAPLAIILVLYGCRAAPSFLRETAFGVGVGMTLFGIGYVLVHDGLVHGRLPLGMLLRVRIFRTIVRAHRVHHANTAGGAPFGFFFGKRELMKARLSRASRTIAPARSSSGPPWRGRDRA